MRWSLFTIYNLMYSHYSSRKRPHLARFSNERWHNNMLVNTNESRSSIYLLHNSVTDNTTDVIKIHINAMRTFLSERLSNVSCRLVVNGACSAEFVRQPITFSCRAADTNNVCTTLQSCNLQKNTSFYQVILINLVNAQ